MMRVFVVALLVASPTVVSAQGINQTTRSPTSVNQQRQNSAVVGPGYATQTVPPTNTFNSPFTSPFAPSNLPNNGRSGYAGSGPR